MGFPNPLDVDLGGGLTVGGGLGLGITSLPAIHLNLDTLPAIHLSVDQIPKIQLGVDPVEIRLTEIPSVRGHLPADFRIGMSILGFELLSVRLCGEAMIITEPYRPNPCEVCGALDLVRINAPPAPEAAA
jgi:hypothetical protein